jgi:hypothetical protein
LRFPRLRFRMRTLMLSIAVSAVVMGVAVGLWRRAESLKRIAVAHAREAHADEDAAWGCVKFGRDPDGTISPVNRELAKQFGKLSEFHRLLKEKYELAASRPCLPVPPAPPSPPVP